MYKEFYVIKFGEKYYRGMTTGGRVTELSLVDDLLNAQKYKDLDRENIQHLLDTGGSAVEVNIREYDRTFSLEKEWEENAAD